jgi:hypothetical protein
MQMRRCLLVVGFLLFLAVPGFGGNCVECDTNQDCVNNITATACECRIRSVGLNMICRPVGFCELGCGSGGPPPVVMGQIFLDRAALDRLLGEEPMLATLFSASVVATKGSGRQVLDTVDYEGGTLRGENGEVFYHNGSFSLRGPGEVFFQFSLRSLGGDESMKYVGLLTDGGRHIQYTKIQEKGSGLPERSTHDWRPGQK